MEYDPSDVIDAYERGAADEDEAESARSLRVELPREFIVPGETRVSAALELARTILRRAERRAVTLADQDAALRDGHMPPYLNRLADLLWILARVAEQAEAKPATKARVNARVRSSANPPKPTHTARAEGREP